MKGYVNSPQHWVRREGFGAIYFTLLYKIVKKINTAGKPAASHFTMSITASSPIYCYRLVMTNILHSILTWVCPKIPKIQHIQNIIYSTSLTQNKAKQTCLLQYMTHNNSSSALLNPNSWKSSLTTSLSFSHLQIITTFLTSPLKHLWNLITCLHFCNQHISSQVLASILYSHNLLLIIELQQ